MEINENSVAVQNSSWAKKAKLIALKREEERKVHF